MAAVLVAAPPVQLDHAVGFEQGGLLHDPSAVAVLVVRRQQVPQSLARLQLPEFHRRPLAGPAPSAPGAGSA